VATGASVIVLHRNAADERERPPTGGSPIPVSPWAMLWRSRVTLLAAFGFGPFAGVDVVDYGLPAVRVAPVTVCLNVAHTIRGR
jgi:hypothetical protein